VAARAPLRRRDPLIALVVVVISVIPWRLWLARHGIHGDVAFADGLSPHYLAERADRAAMALRELARVAVGADWLLILPAAMLVTAMAWVTGPLRPLAWFHLTAALGFFAALVWVYTVSRNDIDWYLGTSASRTITALVFMGMSAIVHMSEPGGPMAHTRHAAHAEIGSDA
jgi:hypothetical protein